MSWFAVSAFIQIVIIAVALYYAFQLFKGTRSAQMLMFLCGAILVLGSLSKILQLDVIEFLIAKLWLYIGLALLVIFQPEIRRMLSYLGRFSYGIKGRKNKDLVSKLLETVEYLSRNRIGGLIAIERQISLNNFCQTGTVINAQFEPMLVESIFFENTPLHDGGIIVRDGVILAARCVFPVSGTDIGRGMRHRAGIGLSEETDAVVIIVSEQTGDISIAVHGKFVSKLSRPHLRRCLELLFKKSGFADAVRQALDEIEKERSVGVVPDEGE